jgi:6-phosphogluconolactonase
MAAQRAAAHITRQLRNARELRGVAHLALSGGTTPGRTYELLGADAEDLGDVQIWFADERCVPPEDEESNYRLVAQTLLARAGIASARVHRMEGEAGPQEGARRYAEELVRHLPNTGASASPPPVLDLIVLGIGPDGHVASLFPGAPTLDAGEEAICLGVEDSPKPPPQRITLSLAVLRAARECLVLATDASKTGAVSAMLAAPSRHVPASLLRRERLTIIVDDAAAPERSQP